MRVVLVNARVRDDLLDDTQPRVAPGLFVLTLDQCKCFDRISLDGLEQIAAVINAPAFTATVKMYRQLTRFLTFEDMVI